MPHTTAADVVFCGWGNGIVKLPQPLEIPVCATSVALLCIAAVSNQTSLASQQETLALYNTDSGHTSNRWDAVTR